MTSIPYTCPNCGAPLTVDKDQTVALCFYCDTIVQLAASQATPPDGDRAASVAPEAVRKIKQYLLMGQRGAAIRLYQQAAGVDEAQAATAILVFARQISLGVVKSQQLNLRGVIAFLLLVFGLVAVVVAGVAGIIPPLAAVILGGAGLALLWPLARGPATTVRYLAAPRAEATVQRVAPIGQIGEAHVFRVLLEVQPPGGTPFQAEMNLPVRRRNVPNLHPGLVLRIKYLRDDPNSVIFDGIAE